MGGVACRGLGTPGSPPIEPDVSATESSRCTRFSPNFGRRRRPPRAKPPPRAYRQNSDYLHLHTDASAASTSSEGGVHVAATDETASLKYPGGELDLDIVKATEGV